MGVKILALFINTFVNFYIAYYIVVALLVCCICHFESCWNELSIERYYLILLILSEEGNQS